jgi:hypothetical protein
MKLRSETDPSYYRYCLGVSGFGDSDPAAQRLSERGLSARRVSAQVDTGNTQTWLIVRLPQPTMPDQPTKVEAIDRTPPPFTPAKKES